VKYTQNVNFLFYLENQNKIKKLTSSYFTLYVV